MRQVHLTGPESLYVTTVKSIRGSRRKTRTAGFSMAIETHKALEELAETLDIYSSNIVESLVAGFIAYCNDHPSALDKLGKEIQKQKNENIDIVKSKRRRTVMADISQSITAKKRK